MDRLPRMPKWEYVSRLKRQGLEMPRLRLQHFRQGQKQVGFLVLRRVRNLSQCPKGIFEQDRYMEMQRMWLRQRREQGKYNLIFGGI